MKKWSGKRWCQATSWTSLECACSHSMSRGYCWRQKEPTILISTLLLQTHAPQLYSLALTRFCWNLESSTTNAWNSKNAIFSRASRVTFGVWITWTSCIGAAPTYPVIRQTLMSSSLMGIAGMFLQSFYVTWLFTFKNCNGRMFRARFKRNKLNRCINHSYDVWH